MVPMSDAIFLPDDLWTVSVDKEQMKQVLHHLLMNARESMPDGGAITIRAENKIVTERDGLPLNEGAYVLWSVTDHGAGIPRENLSRIFDPYFTTKGRDSTKGMGLGLAICYSIIKRHDGWITVASEPDSETTFAVYLPVAVTEGAVRTASHGDAAEKDKADSVSRGKGKILIMDDEEFICDMMKRVLSYLGYDVTVATDGDEAIEHYKNAMNSDQPFSTVILDLAVSRGMGGDIAIGKLLQIDPSVKAIVMSGCINDEILVNYRKYGFHGALTKPFTIEKMKSVVSDVLSQ